jgi:uncharacterized protein YprB with RNaseH-like and TPR domain
MLTNTFRHIPGGGLKTEQQLWNAGIHTWDDFDHCPLRLSAARKDTIRTHLIESKEHLADNPLFFSRLLKSDQQWRLFPHFRHSTLYFDIETTGLSDFHDHITTIATYDGTMIKTYVHGINLDDFLGDIDAYDVFVSYNGKCFDLPFIEKFFACRIDKAHIDLRFVLRGLGYSGGLKGCEKQLGLDRGELAGVDGYLAVLLWREYMRSGNEKALETLLAYNIEDVVNLEFLMVESYNLHLQRTPFYPSLLLAQPVRPLIPFQADKKVLDRIRTIGNFW